MVAIRKKLAAKAVTKKTAAKKPAVKTTVKTDAKANVKATAKKAVKKVTKKVAKKPSGKTAKKVAKKAAKKIVAKTVKKAVKKAAAKAPPPAKAVKPATASRTVAPIPKAPPSPAPLPPVSLKGLRGVSGAKAARIAQIVAESFLPKPTAVKPSPGAPTMSATTAEPGSAPDAALNIADKAAAVLFSKKAEDVVLMDLRNLSTVADYYLIATCQNEPQMRAILGNVQRTLSRSGIKSLRSEYMPGVRWAVVDYGDLILHLFEKQTRGFYSLERLWADAPSTTLKASDYALDADEDGTDADEDGDL